MALGASQTGSETNYAVQRITAAVQASDFKLARDLAEAELTRGNAHPVFYNARAMWHEREQRDVDAAEDYTRSHWLAPDNALILNALGLCQMRLHKIDDAVDSFDKAIQAAPYYLPSYSRKGMARLEVGDVEGAKLAFESGLAVDSRNHEALANLASIAAQRGDMEEAEIKATQALKLFPGEPTAQAVLAFVDIANGSFEAAERRAKSLLANPHIIGPSRARLLGILGDALDGQQKADEAFAAYSAENGERIRLSASRFAGRMTITNLCENMIQFFESVTRWPSGSDAPESHAAPASGHVFLMGFYRSGTTLLEQVLESHPAITTLEERDFLEDLAEQYLTSKSGLSNLETASEAVLAAARATYWERVANEGVDVRGKIFVDKHPLNTIKLPLIAKLFPDAKIIFALRDPRDVVLSCFRRHFKINAAMYELLTLQGAASAYDATMALTTALRPKLALPVLEHRYEELVADFEHSVRTICDFIGVPFDKAMADFRAVQRPQEIVSPSGLQVRQELYRDSVGHWRMYEAHLASIRPTLDHWAQHFGYPLE